MSFGKYRGIFCVTAEARDCFSSP